jgi:hypothetical protein
MFRPVKMLGGVFVLRRIAAGRMPASQAHAEVNPCVAGFHAVFTHVFVGGSHFDLVEMRALLGHDFPRFSTLGFLGWLLGSLAACFRHVNSILTILV